MKYIGNKFNLLSFIEESLQTIGAPSKGSFTDLFSGTTSVAEHFKKLGFSVTANDFMTYSYVLQKAFIESNSIPAFRNISKALELEELGTPEETILYYLNTLKPTEGYAFNNYGAGGSRKT